MIKIGLFINLFCSVTEKKTVHLQTEPCVLPLTVSATEGRMG